VGDRVAFLQSTDLLGSVPEALLASIDARLEEVSIDAGEVLFEEGEEGDAVYLVLEGELRLAIDGITLMDRAPGESTTSREAPPPLPRPTCACCAGGVATSRKPLSRIPRWPGGSSAC
jgi:hypothetical protein